MLKKIDSERTAVLTICALLFGCGIYYNIIKTGRMKAMELMGFYIPSAVFYTINFIVLYFVLKKILFKPVTEFMEKRTENIKISLENAENQKKEVELLKSQYENKIIEARIEADKILDEARKRAEKEYEESISKAGIDAEAIVQKGRELAKKEKEEAINSAKSQIAVLAIAAASKIIEANMDNDKNKALVKSFIEEGVA